MNIKDKEHQELLEMFEKEYKHLRKDKENKNSWSKGRFYQDGNCNELFLAYRKGYAFGKAISN
jgi:hypothetical protein